MGKKIVYAVERTIKGGTQTMFHSTDYKKAVAFYNAHPRATSIQKYRDELYGVTVGRIQPSTPNKIKRDGKTYSRVYVGPHTKASAQKLVKGLQKSDVIKGAVAKKFKKGWFIFVR